MANLALFHLLDEPLTEGLVDALLYIKPVRAHASLSSHLELTSNGTCYGSLEVSVIEHDKRRIPSKLQAQLLQRMT